MEEYNDLKAWNEQPHPQDELPTEVVQVYVMRDYRRMYLAFEKYRKLADMNMKQIEARVDEIAARRKVENAEIMEMRLNTEKMKLRISELMGLLSQEEALIHSLRIHCANQRDMLAVHEQNLSVQRQQIRSLLEHIGGGDDGRDVLASCDASWSADRWKEAMVTIDDVKQQLAELQEAVRQHPLDEVVKHAIVGAIQIIRNQAQLAYNRTARIAASTLRREFGVDDDADDIIDGKEDKEYGNT